MDKGADSQTDRDDGKDGRAPQGAVDRTFRSYGSDCVRRKKKIDAQHISILKEAEAGAKVTELYSRHGISDATLYT